MQANQKTVATHPLENSRKGFRNAGKVLNLLERFYNCGKGFTTEKKLERF